MISYWGVEHTISKLDERGRRNRNTAVGGAAGAVAAQAGLGAGAIGLAMKQKKKFSPAQAAQSFNPYQWARASHKVASRGAAGKVTAGVIGATYAGGAAAGALAGRKKKTSSEVAKRDAKKSDHSGAMVGTGGTAATVGLVGGGIPGTHASRNLGDVRNAPSRGSQARNMGRAYGAGEFGYRTNAHHTYKTFGLHSDLPKNATKQQAFRHGEKLGGITAEDKIIRHLKIGRRASNVALVGGTALAGAGLYQHHKNKPKTVAKAAKKDTYGADVATSAGATTAVLAGGLSHTLDTQGRQWSKKAAGNFKQAHSMNPKMGSFSYKAKNKTRVPHPQPDKLTDTIAGDHADVFRGKTRAHAEAAGRLHGEANQARYFAKTYGKFAKVTRGVGLAGAGVAAAGLGAKYESNKHVKKSLAMPKGVKIPGTSAFTDLKGAVHFSSDMPKLHPGNPQRVLNTTRRPKRKLVRSGARQRATLTGGVAKSFLEMPGMFADPDTRTEQLSTVRTRDVKTGRFVGAPTLVSKLAPINVGRKTGHALEVGSDLALYGMLGTGAAAAGGGAAASKKKKKTMVAKPMVSKSVTEAALGTASWAVPVGWLGVDTKRKRRKMDPATTVTLTKKEGIAHA